MSMRNFLHYLLLIAHPTVVFLVASLTLGFLLTTYAGLAGIVLAPLLLMWLFNYSYVLLEHIANGAREPPVLAIEMLNPSSGRCCSGQSCCRRAPRCCGSRIT
jgi:hypothetical protein